MNLSMDLVLLLTALLVFAAALLYVRQRSWTRRRRGGASFPDDKTSRKGAVQALVSLTRADGIRSLRPTYKRFLSWLPHAEAAIDRYEMAKTTYEQLAEKFAQSKQAAEKVKAAISYRMSVLGASMLLAAEVAVIAPVFMFIDSGLPIGLAVLRAAGLSLMLFLAGKALARVYFKIDTSVYSLIALAVVAVLAIAALATALATIYGRLPIWAYATFLAGPAAGSFFLSVHSHSPEARAARVAGRRVWRSTPMLWWARKRATRALGLVSAAAGKLELLAMERIGELPTSVLHAGDLDPAAAAQGSITFQPSVDASRAPGAVLNLLGQVGVDAMNRYLRLAQRWSQSTGQPRSVLDVAPRSKDRRVRHRTYEGNGHWK